MHSIPQLLKARSNQPVNPYSEKVLPQVIEEEDLMMPGDFKKDKYEIKLGGEQTVDFDYRDPIFNLTAPNLDKKASRHCSFCNKDLKHKPANFCEFCGNRCCDKCLHKTLSFKKNPNRLLKSSIMVQSMTQSMISTPSPSRGKACKICDNKFMMYKVYS